MIGATLQQDSRARSNTVGFLALFLGLSVFIHGLFYPKEWLLFGFLLSAYIMSSFLYKRSIFMTEEYFGLGLTDFLLLGFLAFSLLGLLHPIKYIDGLLEALRWGVFWFVYRLGIRISSDEKSKRYLLQYIEWIAIAIAVIGWLPWIGKVGGRLSSVFGYPNAAAAFLGAALLLYPQRKLVLIFLAVSLVGTGSRAGVGLFLIVLGVQQIFLRVNLQKNSPSLSIRQRFHWRPKMISRYLRGLLGAMLGIAGTILIPLYYKSAWENLTAWGFSSSSWQERIVYFQDGISLAWNSGGVPQAGGWLAFPAVQHFPYWTADPHSSFIHILLNQGFLGIVSVGIWGSFSLAKAWKIWGRNKQHISSMVELEESKAQLKVSSALVFLALHSLVDADFSFGALGILFWLLFGILRKRRDYSGTIFSKQNKLLPMLSNMGMLGLSFIFCLICGSALLNPKMIEREQIWNAQAVQYRELDPEKSVELWGKSLKRDQTQVKVRQELAEHLLRQGNLDFGLETVKEVLLWQPFELEAYEWAQSVVWDAAEVNRQAQPEMTMLLYQWVEEVPETIEERADDLNDLDLKLWQGHKNFRPSQHIKLLADYARQRQLTQLLPQHKL
ncbi:O-antigen ligase family protein [Desulfosporosinus shakirovi]|uniref:O-antigen ligase family protein n=1 Tax=Desulfosporosinus shakirovi TaxID=2885154 RepID=UPI001E32336C|nr:O-antigen ligase family protein [Desulfosporosinus sp. SRJS8]MCB8816224.1 O-antigen ligase domain-containing protein [Desulfosporosinus sp. SRJS8]